MCPRPFGASSSSSRAQQAAAIWAAPSCVCFSCFCIVVSRSASHAWLPRKRAGFAFVPSLILCSSRSRWLGGIAERLSSLIRQAQHPQRWRHTRTRRSARHLRRVGSAKGVAEPVRLSKGRGAARGVGGPEGAPGLVRGAERACVTGESQWGSARHRPIGARAAPGSARRVCIVGPKGRCALVTGRS